jgi:hypothetical protein
VHFTAKKSNYKTQIICPLMRRIKSTTYLIGQAIGFGSYLGFGISFKFGIYLRFDA